MNIGLLFDVNFWLLIGIGLFICFGIRLFVKHPEFRVAVISVAFVGIVGLTVYCGVNLNTYLSASGGIFGTLTGYHQPEVEIKDCEFDFKGMVLEQQLDTDTYSCRILSSDVFSYNSNCDYDIFANNSPCNNVEVRSNYISADYTYSFYNERNELMHTDTLNIRITLDLNSTYAVVWTDGGSESVGYWNQYLQRNNFVVALKETKQSIEERENFNAGVPEGYNVAYFYDGDTLLKTCLVETNNYLEEDQIPITNSERIVGWSLDNENFVEPTTQIMSKDLVFRAIIGKTLEEYSWAEIAEISESNLASKYFKVGDTKTIEMQKSDGSFVDATAVILDFNHDNLSVGTGKAGISFGIRSNAYFNRRDFNLKMNTEDSNNCSWENCYIRTNVVSTAYEAMSEELQSVIKSVKKRTTAGNKSTDIIETDDKVWVYSAVEVFGSDKDSTLKSNVGYALEGSQYSYWKENTYLRTDVTNPFMKVNEDIIFNSEQIWLRSPSLSNNSNFMSIQMASLYSSGASFLTATTLLAGFCI